MKLRWLESNRAEEESIKVKARTPRQGACGYCLWVVREWFVKMVEPSYKK